MTPKIKQKLPKILFLILLFIVFLYNFSYLFPFTNNAFVVANTRPVAANVQGYITGIYVKNEEYVKKGHPLFTVFQKPYELTYKRTKSDVEEAKAQLIVLTKQVEKSQYILQSQQDQYEKLGFDYNHYKSAYHDNSVSEIEVHTSLKARNSALNKLNAFKKELELNSQKVLVQKLKIESLIAVMENAKVDLDETTVYAKNDGIVQNMYVSLGTPIEIRKPLFSFVDINNMFIQANFSEIDLRRVQPGHHVTIWPRIYFGGKTYHGIVTSKNWAASRQTTDHRNQQQIVTNSENNWILLPQRFPVQIKITDYDPVHYPLSIGASTYVYIHTY